MGTRPSRVLFVQQYLPIYDAVFYNALVSRYGYDLFVAADIESASSLNQHGKIPALYTAVHLHWISRLGILLTPGLLAAVAKIEPDVIIALGNPRYLTLLHALLVWRLKSRPAAVWGMFHRNGPPRLPGQAVYPLMGRLARACLTYGPRGARELTRLGIDPSRIQIMSTSVDLSACDEALKSVSLAEVKALLARCGLEEKVVFLQVARLRPGKRTSFLVESMRELADRHPDAVLVLLGDGPEKESIAGLIDLLNLRRNIVMVPSSFDEKELCLWFLAARAVTSGGAVGLLAIHAAAYSAPLIAHDNLIDHGSEAESIVHGETGLLYKSGDKQSLVEALSFAVGHPEEMRRMGRQGRKNTEEKYSLSVKTERFHSAIQALLRNAPVNGN